MLGKLSLLKQRALHFCLVGVVGFVVDAAVLLLVLRNTDLGLLQARAISFLVAVFVTWRLNRKFTFARSSGPSAVAACKEFIKYLSANSFGIAINLGVYSLLVLNLSFFSDAPQFAVAVGSVAALSVNFVLSNYWVFR